VWGYPFATIDPWNTRENGFFRQKSMNVLQLSNGFPGGIISSAKADRERLAIL